MTAQKDVAWRRGWLRVATIGLLLLGLVGWSLGPHRAAAQDATEPDASVRFIHASPGAPNVDFLVDGQAVARDIEFGQAADYVALPGGDHKVQVVPAGQTAESAVIDTDLNVDSGEVYIFLAMGRLNDIEGKVYQVDTGDLDEGKARVRLIHASPDAGKVDVAVTGGDMIFDDVDFGDASDYTDLDAGVYSLDVKDQDGRVLLNAPDVAVEAGYAYDIVALGLLEDRSLALLTLTTRVTAPCGEVLGLHATEKDACLRVVHAVEGGPAVDVFVNGEPVVPNLTFGSATEFAVIPAGGGRKIEITAAGTPPGDQDLVDLEQDLDNGTAYQIVVMGNPDDVSGEVMRLDLAPLPSGQARVRVVHASPDAGNVDIVLTPDQKLFEDVAFKDRPPYKILDAGTVTLQVRKAGEQTVVLESEVTFEAGQVYDMIVLGRAADQSLKLLILSAPAPLREGGVATPAEGTPGPGTTAGTPVGTAEPVATATPED
ncbi:MAG: hypothetical protein C4346_14795 [Chloroflexota bacterium]